MAAQKLRNKFICHYELSVSKEGHEQMNILFFSAVYVSCEEGAH